MRRFSISVFWENHGWESDARGGPVGRMDAGNIPNDRTAEGNLYASSLGTRCSICWKKLQAWGFHGQSTFDSLHHLLGRLGLVVIDLDHQLAKQACIQIFEQRN